MSEKDSTEDRDKKIFQVSYYAILLILGAVIGYNVKLIASRHITAGFEDGRVKTAQSDYDFNKASEALKKLQEESSNAQAGAEQAAPAGAEVPTEGSCGE